MKRHGNPFKREMDPEILERMPLWFRKLREAYLDEKKQRGGRLA